MRIASRRTCDPRPGGSPGSNAPSLHPNWPSHGNLAAAFGSAMGHGGIGGLLLGTLYLWSRGNLLACAVLQAGFSAAWARTMIRVGGG